MNKYNKIINAYILRTHIILDEKIHLNFMKKSINESNNYCIYI